jgi:phosphocarrier protein HPr
MIEKTFVLNDDEGLHARPASVLSKVVMKFTSKITLIKDGQTGKVYNPKSILSLMSMGAGKGDKLVFTVDGEDEDVAMLKISELFENNFQG